MASDVEKIEAALRELIIWRDWLASETIRIEAMIAQDARLYADATGVKVKPTLDQLRWQLLEKEKAQRPAA